MRRESADEFPNRTFNKLASKKSCFVDQNRAPSLGGNDFFGPESGSFTWENTIKYKNPQNLDTEFDELEIEDAVAQAMANFEPRAILRQVIATLLEKQNTVNVKVIFQVVNVAETQELSINLTRLR